MSETLYRHPAVVKARAGAPRNRDTGGGAPEVYWGMVDWAWLPAAIAGYFALTRWVLPRLGVKT